ncbi:MAG: carbon monoxide dehydrogenase beta subunit family protein [Candidatus Hodarchaeota archaeon]
MSKQPWQLGNHPGPVKNAKELSESMLQRLIKEPTLIIVGSTPDLTEHDGKPTADGQFVIEMTKLLAKKGVTVFSTPGGFKLLNSHNVEVRNHAGITILCKKLSDKDWNYFGKEIKTVILAGMPHYLQSQALSALRHNAPHVKTVSLEPYFSPNADYSSPTIGRAKKAEWFEKFKAAVS